MKGKRPPRARKGHYALLVNKSAKGYNAKQVSKLIGAIRSKGASYSIFEPESAMAMFHQSEVAVGLRRASAKLPRPFDRGGKVTALLACGGDGTFNLIARTGWKADIPVGILPMGRLNNIALSLYGSADPDVAVSHILSTKARAIDVGRAGNLPFYGSLGIGFTVNLTEELNQRTPPRFGLGWSKLGSAAAAQVSPEEMVLKVDSFRFEISPLMFSVNLLAYTAGLPLSPVSITDDGMAEIVFDVGPSAGHFSSFARLIHKKKFLYGDEFRLYRGRSIVVQSDAGRKLCLDGEVIELPAEILEIRLEDKKLQVLH